MKATALTIRARVEELVLILLDGAQPWDVRHYVSEKQENGDPPWTVPEGEKPLSERQIRRYCDRAERMIQESHRTSRRKLLRRHLAQRRNLYAKAVSAGDHRAALAAARDEAELLGLYPPKGVALTGDKGGPVELKIIEEVVGKEKPVELDSIAEEVVTAHDSNSNSNAASPNNPTPSSTERVPTQ